MNDFFAYYTDNGGALLTQSVGTILLSLLSIVISIVIGVPLGAYVGHLRRFSFLAVNGGNVLRALPTLALVAILIVVTGFGLANILICLVVLALPLILTNTFVAVEGVSPGIVEAARGMGMTDWQILSKAELPNALPLIIAGIRTAWVYVVATSYLAVFAGWSGTLGDTIGNVSGNGLAGVLAASVLAIIIAFGGSLVITTIERAITPTGLKLARAAALAPA